jgi:hypothetical protein
MLDRVREGGRFEFDCKKSGRRRHGCNISSSCPERDALSAAFASLESSSARAEAAAEIIKILDVLVLPDSDLWSAPHQGGSPTATTTTATTTTRQFRWDGAAEAAKLEAMLVGMTSRRVPTAVTIARSTVDEFCPEDICDRCEQMCLDVLQKVWPGERFAVDCVYKMSEGEDSD